MKRTLIIMLVICLAIVIGVFVVYDVKGEPGSEAETVANPDTQPLPDPNEFIISDEFESVALELPILSITTNDGKTNIGKDIYKECTASLTNTLRKYTFDDLSAGIRIRGNATAGMEKKSFRIKFTEKINPLGQGKGSARSWVLMANHCDQAMLRNYMGFRLVTIMDGVGVSISTNFVEVYLNGEYQGVYLLADQIQIGQSRVNVRTSITSPETDGYLIELDQYAEGQENIDWIRVYGSPYSIKNDVRSEELAGRIKTKIEAIEEALAKEDEEAFCALVDIDSCVDIYLIEEFSKNIDVGWSSFYMYVPKEGDKLYFGPAWDFDLAFGNDERLDRGDYEDLYVATGRRGFSQSHRWFIQLMNQDWFVQKVLDRWDYAYKTFTDILTEAEEVYQSMEMACDHNFEKWPIFGQRKNQEPQKIMKLKSAREHVTYMIEWSANRLAWLDDYYKSIMN